MDINPYTLGETYVYFESAMLMLRDMSKQKPHQLAAKWALRNMLIPYISEDFDITLSIHTNSWIYILLDFQVSYPSRLQKYMTVTKNDTITLWKVL